ncbi:CLP protease proteolytic subunit 2 [Actinidia rufa]|uniref:ATP-dependent Clp protease proteolytic subunit n=1 Tax=Actinidia rufa TaxID=165716 RepID=A0A7J0DFK2_9ERIC|nr:CLP protease proteolytic subunit 2 [Actinidia rufa]
MVKESGIETSKFIEGGMLCTTLKGLLTYVGMAALRGSLVEYAFEICGVRLRKALVFLRFDEAQAMGKERACLNTGDWTDHRALRVTSDSKPRRLRIVMMPMVPVIRRRNGRYVERLDLWNALHSIGVVSGSCMEQCLAKNGGLYLLSMCPRYLPYRDRIVFIGNYINETFGNKILATLLYLDSTDNSKLLSVLINGVGGDITPSLSIYDTMQILRSPVGTRCVGSAFNLSAFLLAAGDKGFRLAMPMSRISMQPLAGTAQGKADAIINESYELLRFRDYIYEELAKKTGHPLEKINKDFKMTMYFDAKGAIEYGLIDDIVRPVVKSPSRRKLGMFGI